MPSQSQCFVRWPEADVGHGIWRLHDCLSDAVYDRDGADLVARGLFLDLPAWGYHVFDLKLP